MNEQCLACTIRKICDREEPRVDWTCMYQDGHSPEEWARGVRTPRISNIDITMLRLSIKNACDQLFADHDMKETAYDMICSTVEHDIYEDAEKCDEK